MKPNIKSDVQHLHNVAILPMQCNAHVHVDSHPNPKTFDNKNALNKKDAKIMFCDYSEITKIFEDFHYKKSKIGGGISICFALVINNKIAGGAVLGLPRHEKKYKDSIDIRRMACLDSAPFNSESFFLSQIIKWIASNTEYKFVLSYSDLTVGHIGTIYKAANFKNIGLTTPTKYVEWNGEVYHPRSLSIDRDYSRRLNEDLKNGKAKLCTGEPKNIWLFEIKKRKKMPELNRYTICKGTLTLF